MGMDAGKGRARLAQRRCIRTPEKSRPLQAQPSRRSSASLGPKHPPALTAPRHNPFTHQQHGTLRLPIKQHHCVGLSSAVGTVPQVYVGTVSQN